ncbi:MULTISPECIES: hypothetical protein [Haemophilus]|uniref:Uncharacterized protein n=1 Tax=Haemophilus aegyptius TaxID=197575 RepID=A0ABY1VTB2_HAEAE|nr:MULTISPECIES: hypothetical protein [Haemophilus]EGF19326.1 hypothetical protein HMPREF9095_0047 [Haemophilus aegyptius ATCC 11116]SQH36328.1 Uncharacterised protein [Haemophilus aegyptius]VEH52501.1 Uncharacterised protein [Haemophilus aegyptius]
MATIIVKRDAGSRKFTEKGEILQRGKAGRLERMFDKQRRINAAFEKMVVKESAADRAIKFAANRQKEQFIDIANYPAAKVNLLVQTPCTQCRSAD